MRPASGLLAITPGEPAGIGPDLVLQLAAASDISRHVIIADSDMLKQRAVDMGIDVKIHHYDSSSAGTDGRPGILRVLHVPLRTPVTAGQLDKANGIYVLETLTRAAQGCLQGEFAAMVTAPVHKGVINDAGVPFSGHTEFLAELCGDTLPVMMLAADTLRVALVTTHLPLRQVSDAITPQTLENVLRILHQDLQTKFGLNNPRILVCGLNPHAGEGGHLGTEEITVIEPVLNTLREQGFTLIGPLPADTLFTPANLARGDAVLAMYHDQGLPVLKYLGFGNAVNITLGLPIIRTSVDHGTALDLAGSGKASTGSLQAAIRCAEQMVAARLRH